MTKLGPEELAPPDATIVAVPPLDVEAGGVHKVLSMERLSSLDNDNHLQIVYTDLKFTVMVKEKGQKVATQRDILKGISGVIQPGRITAVMGASGAGKTTMLNVLAGHVRGSATVTGKIKVNGEAMDGARMRRISGFVHQEDVIMDTMTVREALLFAAKLKLPREMSNQEKERRALDVAHLLNLTKSLDNVVGSSLLKGISGGEKRRLSLGMEMITNPSILFLDEPTSGLDSYTAYKVARIMSNVAHKYGRTIVCTIHQPSSEVFAIFDDLIVLAEGRVLYHGPVPQMVPYFARLGYQCPQHFNPADFLFMDILNAGGTGTDDKYDFIVAKASDEEARQQAREQEAQRLQGLLTAWEESRENQAITSALTRSQTLNLSGISSSAILTTANFFTQFNLLAQRTAKNSWRNNLIFKGKLAQTVFLAIVVGLIFLRVKDDQQGVQDRQGSLFFIVVQAFFGAVMGVLTVFGGEKAVFTREYGSGMYGLPSYFISRWAVDLPSHIVMPVLFAAMTYWFVGFQNIASKFWWYALILVLVDCSGTSIGIFVSCLFNDISVALSVMPMFLLPLMVFSGFFVNSANLGWWFNWLSYISPMKYGFIALIKNEFQGLVIHCDPESAGCTQSGIRSGEDVISTMGFDNLGTVEFNAGILFLLMGGFLALAYVALWWAVRRSQH